MLKHQKNREQVTGFLTDCHHVMFVRAARKVDDLSYSVWYSDPMSLNNHDTTCYLQALLSEIQFHPMTGILHADSPEMQEFSLSSCICIIL